MTDTTELTEHDEIEMLLPWYVMGRLDAAEHRRVEAYLDSNPAMRQQLKLIEDERLATVEAQEAIALPHTLTADRLLAKATPATAQHFASAAVSRTSDQAQSLWSGLASLFSAPSPRAVRFAAAAVVALFMAQAFAIGFLATGSGSPGQIELASGDRGGAQAIGTRALVRFKPGAGMDLITTELTAAKLEIVGGPNQSGFFEVRLSRERLASDALEARLVAIRDTSRTILVITPTGN
ncbi:MAG: hypothetical protein AAFY53_01775 [Pseudomonadota bacterium]